MKRFFLIIIVLMSAISTWAQNVPTISATNTGGSFPLSAQSHAADIYIDANDFAVVNIAAQMLADDIERVTSHKATIVKTKKLSPSNAAVVAGTIGHSALIDYLISQKTIDVAAIKGKWESYAIATAKHPKTGAPLLVIAGSDRRGTAFGLTTLCESIGVSPWYWWADVVPEHKDALYVSQRRLVQGEPSVQYRGIFINDERFGGWARWAENNFDSATGKVGPKTYQKVFELLLRLKANYLWPAMHPGTQAFNDDPENARLANDYAIVMGSSHCEQMLRNNEGEWKAVNEKAKARGEKGLGDFNYITNRQTMQKYWEDRVKTNGKYENTYTLGLRGIHDYPMEGANSTKERVAIMQQAINDQRDMLRRNIKKPVEQIPQVLCTYEEVLDAYHNGLQVPDDVTLLWSDDKHGYCRNLCNPDEQKRSGGAGIYYHLSYHGDPASWIWLSPLSPAFISAELTKAYTFGARKIWVFNVGDIKPAEKEISFAMELAWDVARWTPDKAHQYTEQWAAKTFGKHLAKDIANIQQRYYTLQAGGKDAHVWFVDYDEDEIASRLREARSLALEAQLLAAKVPQRLQNAYFELVSYPVCGAAMLNEYQLLARRSMVCATRGDSIGALADGKRVEEMFASLNDLTHQYNNQILNGKWSGFFNWQPYHWFRSEKIDPPYCTPALWAQISQSPKPQSIDVAGALAEGGIAIESDIEGNIPLWIEAVSPVRNFSKAKEDNVFGRVSINGHSFDASATPINNIWHSPLIGPMWSNVGTISLRKGINTLKIDNLKPNARICQIYIGAWPPFHPTPRLTIAASQFRASQDSREGKITVAKGLGFSDGVLVQPFDTPSYNIDDIASAPYVDYQIDVDEQDQAIEIRTLPTLHVYEGRDARFAVQFANQKPQVFSIHTGDFAAEWRLNVLRGYAKRCIQIPPHSNGRQRVRIYLLDQGIVLQEIMVR
ncbi:MAG: glycosyl hydrolase 115 family protein [Bacteroidales bacterium]|nr:glycosyl hydrolase 115 family protein [Bacteroidales bacterium]